MTENRCQICGRVLSTGEACYHDEKQTVKGENKRKMTQLPWMVDDVGIRRCDRQWYIVTIDEVHVTDANAIVAAMNNTYGAGINPQAVPSLLEAAKWALSALEFEGEPDASNLLRKAIEKAKL